MLNLTAYYPLGFEYASDKMVISNFCKAHPLHRFREDLMVFLSLRAIQFELEQDMTVGM